MKFRQDKPKPIKKGVRTFRPYWEYDEEDLIWFRRPVIHTIEEPIRVRVLNEEEF